MTGGVSRPIYARSEKGKVCIYWDIGCKTAAGAFPLDRVDRLGLTPNKTREIEMHGIVWKILWLPEI